MKRIIRYLRTAHTDVYIYRITAREWADLPEIQYSLQKTGENEKIRYFINVDGVRIHNSMLFPKLRLLRLIGKSAPAIGECWTSDQYRGQSIYPYVINKMAGDALNAGAAEVFIVVNKDNTSSIRGIEKAGFKRFAAVSATRRLGFYTGVKVDFE